MAVGRGGPPLRLDPLKVAGWPWSLGPQDPLSCEVRVQPQRIEHFQTSPRIALQPHGDSHIILRMRKGKSGGGPGMMTRKTGGKTSISTTMTPVFGAGKGRASAKRLKGRPMTGR